jgi:hypothetical protein
VRRQIEQLNKLIPDDQPKLTLPGLKFHRSIGEHAGQTWSIHDELLSPEEYAKHLDEVLPNAPDKQRLAAVFKDPDWVLPA